MKATYMSPKADILTMSTEQMIAESPLNNYGNPELGQDLGTVETTGATGGNLSRRYEAWDDEYEVEEDY